MEKLANEKSDQCYTGVANLPDRLSSVHKLQVVKFPEAAGESLNALEEEAALRSSFGPPPYSSDCLATVVAAASLLSVAFDAFSSSANTSAAVSAVASSSSPFSYAGPGRRLCQYYGTPSMPSPRRPMPRQSRQPPSPRPFHMPDPDDDDAGIMPPPVRINASPGTPR